MKNLLYIIAGLLVVIWGIVFFGFNVHSTVHLILLLAGLIILVRIILFKNRPVK
jgi:tryptophan-rich sensory protein